MGYGTKFDFTKTGNKNPKVDPGSYNPPSIFDPEKNKKRGYTISPGREVHSPFLNSNIVDYRKFCSNLSTNNFDPIKTQDQGLTLPFAQPAASITEQQSGQESTTLVPNQLDNL
jgi:hypothetical protein